MFSRLFAILFCFWSAGLQTGLFAQIPGLPTTTQPAGPEAETPEQTKTRLQEWLKEARAALSRLDDPAAEAQLPAGITPAALADRRRDLDQMVRTISRTLSLLDQIPPAKEELKAAVIAKDSWSGFPEPPPYSILKLDDLANQLDAAKEKDATFSSSISIFNRSIDGIDRETKAADEATRRAVDLAEKEPASEAAKWQLEAARAKNRYLSVRALFVRANIDLLNEQSAASAARVALIERQIAVVRKNVAFTADDLAAVQKSTDERRALLRKEMSDIRTRLRDASAGLARARATLEPLNTPENQTNPPPELALATARLAAADTRVDTLQFILDNLESFEGLEGFIPVAYENRKTLTESSVRADRNLALESLRSLLDRLNAWEVVSKNELAAVNADLAAQDSNAAAIPPDDPRQTFLADKQKSLWEKQAFLQRISQTVIAHRKNVARWLEGFETSRKSAGWISNLSDSGNSAWSLVRRIWSFEVMKFENVRNVAGVPITEAQSITLGVILSALTFFIIAYILSSRISRRLQNIVVGRGRIAEAQANTLRNWMMIVVGFALALTTLHFLKIPLTVFAFFGGALAIGLGFGTQTLIKNFISGIIVLFERKIRVGDIVDIGGLSGSVSEINTRSSVLRGADGRETLVPNSVFLENSVTNLTLSNRTSRRAILVGVEYGSSVQQVITILTECAERHGLVIKDPQPLVIFQDFAADSLLFKLYFWTAFDGKTNPEAVESDIRTMIHKRFTETDIGFPFPQRDMHLKSDKPLRIQLVEKEEPEAPKPPKSIP